MANQGRRATGEQIASFAASWELFAWNGTADEVDGSQYRRALGSWQCAGCRRPAHAWVAEWLDRDEEAAFMWAAFAEDEFYEPESEMEG